MRIAAKEVRSKKTNSQIYIPNLLFVPLVSCEDLHTMALEQCQCDIWDWSSEHVRQVGFCVICNSMARCCLSPRASFLRLILRSRDVSSTECCGRAGMGQL